MARELLPPFEAQAFREGTLTPIWFGSAINSFGVKELMDGIAEYGPRAAGRNRRAAPDRAGGKEGRGLRLQGAGQHGPQAPRPGGVSCAWPRAISARHETDPCAVEKADGDLEPGAVPGRRPGTGGRGLGRRHHRHSQPRPARIGDTLTEGEALRVTGIPSFAPELLQTCRAGDPMKAKHLDKALMQFAEEGAAKVFKPGHRVGLCRRRGGRAAIRGAGQPDRAANTACGCGSSRRSSPRPAG
jgi:peptide chain release factor 3